MPFEFRKTEIEGVILVIPKVFKDQRGYFMETYEKRVFSENGINTTFVQDNQSYSKKNTLRGLHFQKGEYAQAKLVRCVKGKILDVAVDLRRNSPTFGKYVAVELSEENNYQLFIPRGFAHGFLVLSEDAIVNYKVDNFYNPESEGGLIWNDKTVNINWPIKNPILSEKDKKWKTLRELEESGELF